MPLKKIRNFFELEAAAGIILGLFAIFAIIIANSPFSSAFQSWLSSEHIIQFSNWRHEASLKEWIKDGLMAIFFFHVGLEIKKEILVGELSNPKKLALPVFGALGGMIAPALIYVIVVLANNSPELIKGWPIPVATDIAFAVAAIAIVAKNIPKSMKIFLLTLAVVDDLGAVVLIAALFGHNIDYQALAIALSIFVGLLGLSAINIRRPWIFVFGGLIMWAFMLQSGFHATLAGVLTAIAVPLKSNSENFESPLEDLHDDFSAWVKYAILPLFALSHAGFSFNGLGIDTISAPLFLAIFLGLVLGKPLGVLIFTILASKLGLAHLPQGANIRQTIGIGALCGIGFTMSLFLGGLAFANSDHLIESQIKFGVFSASIISGILGITLLSWKNPQKDEL